MDINRVVSSSLQFCTGRTFRCDKNLADDVSDAPSNKDRSWCGVSFITVAF